MKTQFERYLRKRIKDYPVYINIGPGKDEDSITQITCGYEVHDPGWIALIFDTRRNPAIDGEWNTYIEGNELEIRRWGISPSQAHAEEKIGERIRNYLQAAFDADLFASLPLAAECMLTVEEHNGSWGWSSHQDDSDADYLAKLSSAADGLTANKAVAYWIGILDNCAGGAYKHDDWGFLVADFVVEQLQELDHALCLPLLRFIARWADKQEFDGDRPSRQIRETAMQDPICKALQMVAELGSGTAQELRLLKRILDTALAVNKRRTLWGIIPRCTAETLSQLCTSYPEPKTDARTNRLLNAGAYT